MYRPRFISPDRRTDPRRQPAKPLLLASAVVLAVHVAGLLLLARPPSVGAGDDGRGTTIRVEARTLTAPAAPPEVVAAPAPPPGPAARPPAPPQTQPAPDLASAPPAPLAPDSPAAVPALASASAAAEVEPPVVAQAPPPALAASTTATEPDAGSRSTVGIDSASPMVRPWQPPKPVRLSYEVVSQTQGRVTQARGELVWRHDGQRYDALLEVSLFPFLKRTQTSVGSVSGLGLVPQRFADRGRSEVAAHFRPADSGTPARAVFSANTPDVALKPLAQDRLSVLIQLAGWGLADPAIMAVGQSFTLQTVGPRDAQDWTFTVDDAYILELPGDNIAVYKLSRAPRREYDPLVEVWLAPTLDFMPVRVKITQSSGDFVDQKWRSTELP